MFENRETLTAIHSLLLHLPIVTTLCAAFFCVVLFSRLRAKGGGKHLLWWGIGMATYGLGTFTEAFTTLFGWDPTVFRVWYVAGAFLGGYPLAQGSIYLLMNRKFADRSAVVVSSLIAVAAVLVFVAPLDPSLAEAHRLSGKVIEWQWVRLISPFINLYSVIFLVGGAVLSALRFRRNPEMRSRYVGNVLIAVGALLPGIGGSMTRAGYVEVLYVTELVGLLLIFAGYRKCTAARAPERSGEAMRAAAATAVLLLTLGLAAPALAAQPAPESPAADASADEPAATAESAAGERSAFEPAAPQLAEDDPGYSFFATTTVTATGSQKDTFAVATPVTVIGSEEIERLPVNSASDLLRLQPGVDVNGVGTTQTRPIIRGQRGLRVLFLQNGLRMNNPRRQTDFGEITGLVDLDDVETMEVVRGPASVLYGSDAVGGVLNLITKRPSALGFHGTAALGGGTADDQRRVQAAVENRTERTSLRLGGSYRETESYDVPAGSFGDLTLDADTTVLDSGVTDDSLYGFFDYRLSPGNELSLRVSRYRAEQTGFGLVEPELLGGDLTRVRIYYPYQDFDRVTLGYLGSALESPLADSLDVQAYWQSNERELVNEITNIDIGPIFPGAPSSSLALETLNYTDLDTLGLRAEAVKVVAERHLLTYGVEAYQDDSFNTDFSATTAFIRFPFPPFEIEDTLIDDRANTPNATNTSYGVFVQGELALGDRLAATVGMRYQDVETKAEATPGWEIDGLDFSDDAVVGSINLTYQVIDELNLLASYGTAFRAPNIVERLFEGPTPEGSGYQILNPDLGSEESDNFDLGLKYRRRNAYMEAVLFRTEIDKGIIQDFLSPGEVAALPQDLQDAIDAVGAAFVVQQRNADRLRYEGVEVSLGYRMENGFTVSGNYTYLDSKRIDSTSPPTGDTFADKANLRLRWNPRRRPFWLEYRLRWNGSTGASVDPDEPPPLVGDPLPSFVVHALGGGYTLFDNGNQSHELTVTVENLTDELYSEFSNASFFRPEPGRNVAAGYRLRF